MSNSDRCKTYRQRKAGLTEPLRSCLKCGKQVRSDAHSGLCSRCWYKTTEGKANTAARTRKSREKRKR